MLLQAILASLVGTLASTQSCTSGTWGCTSNNLSVCQESVWTTIVACASTQGCRAAPYFDCNGPAAVGTTTTIRQSPSKSKTTAAPTFIASTTTTASTSVPKTTTTSAVPIPSDACPVGAKVSVYLKPQTNLQARIGSIYGNVLYDSTNTSSNNYAPGLLQVRVVDARGSALSACKVSWTTSQNGGWAFPTSNNSDSNGLVGAYWVAGGSATQTLTASIATADGLTSSAQLQGSAQGHSTRANSVHIAWRVNDFSSFSVDVLPLTWPLHTYYEAIGINDAYCGIQNDRILFSMWEYGGKNPDVIAKHPQATCADFGGEVRGFKLIYHLIDNLIRYSPTNLLFSNQQGTGIQCNIKMVPSANVKYNFRMDIVTAVAGHQDYTVTVTDSSTGISYAIATLRYGTKQTNTSPYGFAEDFGYDTTKPSCLQTELRSVQFSNVKYIPTTGAVNSWITVPKNAITSTAVFTPNYNEVCVNYAFSSPAPGTYQIKHWWTKRCATIEPTRTK
ncbi:UNVERIFIED_CONTAM: hypothetical protein HDU68_003789 [Siphonaria sp. JEL0065]|nr:hypothetical protein HDU68_003789 [Siphonaria sp. JEL0065]